MTKISKQSIDAVVNKKQKNTKTTTSSIPRPKKEKKRVVKKSEPDEDVSVSSDGVKTCPGQPSVTVVEMRDILTTLGFRKHSQWTQEEKDNLAKFMCNRAGIDASDKISMHTAGLTDLFDHWLGEYVALYESDPDFEKAIDPWQVVVLQKPPDNIYIPTLNLANQHIGGLGNANGPNEPVQFMHNVNWLLHIPGGKENARRLVSYMKGDFHRQNIPFSAAIQDYRATVLDA
jgi:hypothetical protein